MPANVIEDASSELASLVGETVSDSLPTSLARLVYDELDHNDLDQFCQDVVGKVVDVMPRDKFVRLHDSIVEKAKTIAAESVLESLQEAAELSIAAQ